MTEQDPNPYESPQAETAPTSAQRTARRLGVWLALPLSIIAGVVAFFATCIPVAQIPIATMSGPGQTNYLVGMVVAGPAVIIGSFAAHFAARAVWRRR